MFLPHIYCLQLWWHRSDKYPWSFVCFGMDSNWVGDCGYIDQRNRYRINSRCHDPVNSAVRKTSKKKFNSNLSPMHFLRLTYSSWPNEKKYFFE